MVKRDKEIYYFDAAKGQILLYSQYEHGKGLLGLAGKADDFILEMVFCRRVMVFLRSLGLRVVETF